MYANVQQFNAKPKRSKMKCFRGYNLSYFPNVNTYFYFTNVYDGYLSPVYRDILRKLGICF